MSVTSRKRRNKGQSPQGCSPTKKLKVFVEDELQLPHIFTSVNLTAAKSTPLSASPRTPKEPHHNTANLWSVRNIRGRSHSVDSVGDSPIPDSRSSTGFPDEGSRDISDTLKISPYSTTSNAVYHPFPHETRETGDLRVPRESTFQTSGLPVRHLDQFAFYVGKNDGDDTGDYLSFDTVIASLLSVHDTRCIKASGKIYFCGNDEDDGDSDISVSISESEPPPLISLLPIDFWVDYSTQEEGIWRSSCIAVQSKHAWYILKQPSVAYSSFYRHFFICHHVTWRAASLLGQNMLISFKEFVHELTNDDTDDVVSVMGRTLDQKDITQDNIITYLYDQFINTRSIKNLVNTPLVRHFIAIANFDVTNDWREYKKRHSMLFGKTVATPLVLELTTGIFSQTSLKAGRSLGHLNQQSRITQCQERPDILNPDCPTNIDFDGPVDGYPGYFLCVSLDGETYRVGDVIMVNPGEDNSVHRAQSALEACSQSTDNELSNKVWFCKLLYIKGYSPRPVVHVRWYEHGAKTILQETAHPYGLYALTECDSIPVQSIMGRCDVQHLKPGDDEPNNYHCSFVWDANRACFLDQSVLDLKSSQNLGRPYCSCCDIKEQGDGIEEHEIIYHSKRHLKIGRIDYHKKDFVYIATKPNSPYQIGQIQRFVLNFESDSINSTNCEVRVRLYGRFDDIVQKSRKFYDGPDKDEHRLFATQEVTHYPVALIEGKCFVTSKEQAIVQDLPDHFFVDRQATSLKVRAVDDLDELDCSISYCDICTNSISKYYENVEVYKKENGPLRTMELFAGAGGLSLGLEQSGFVKTIWAIEIVPGAAATFQKNHPDAVVYNEDTNVCLQNAIDAHDGLQTTPLKTVSGKDHCLMPQVGDIDLITGGFPCQSFSGMNHQRHRNFDDIRTTLVANMLSYVEFYRPRFVLMENVKGLLQHSSYPAKYSSNVHDDDIDDDKVVKMSIVKFVLRALLRLGYQTHFRVLQSADYGSPQRRERVIFWAARRSEPLPEFPLPTHVSPTASHVINLPTHDKLYPVRRSPRNCAPFPALVISDAISDLPGYNWKNPQLIDPENREQHKIKSPFPELTAVSSSGPQWRTLVGYVEPKEYATPPRTTYQRRLRGDEETVSLQCSRTFNATVVERVWYACSPGVRGLEAIPRELWTRGLWKAAKQDGAYRMWQKFFKPLEWDQPFNTALTACRPFCKGSRVLHPTQRRIITARECARSQGFPDSYEFVQTDENGGAPAWAKLLDDIHKQIGNAVPIPLANALGRSLGQALVNRWIHLKTGNTSMHGDE